MDVSKEATKIHLAQVEDALDELDSFRHTPEFNIMDRPDQVLLNRQSQVMHGLVEILNERIARFNLK